MDPIVKWAGGKRKLLSEIQKLVPNDFHSYHEAFLGGGAVLFNLRPQHAIVSDANKELIEMYSVIRDTPEELISLLTTHENNREYYNVIRAANFSLPVTRASRFIYLNKTCFNGLYRVNPAGKFNVPYANRKSISFPKPELIREMSKYLKEHVTILPDGDFRGSVNRTDILAGHFFYFDPPYIPVSKNESFTQYTSNGFGIHDHYALYNLCKSIDERGGKFLLSNAYCPLSMDLYRSFNIKLVSNYRSIGRRSDSRKDMKEILVSNYEQKSI